MSFRNEPLGCGLEAGLEQLAELLARQARRNGVEELDDDGARVAHEAAAGPEEARVERQRYAGQLEGLVEGDVAGFVVRRCAGGLTRALGEDHDLAAPGLADL